MKIVTTAQARQFWTNMTRRTRPDLTDLQVAMVVAACLEYSEDAVNFPGLQQLVREAIIEESPPC